jgi:hypothetical protein
VRVELSLKDIRGIAPGCTGNLSSEDFVRKIRDEDYNTGLSEGIRRAREAVERVSDKYPTITLEDCAICVINECIAAIDAVKGE